FTDYKEITDLVVEKLGKNRPVEGLAAEDFAALRASMAKRWGPVRLGNAITRARCVFTYATENNLIEKSMRYGTEFRRPDKSVMRRHRAQAGSKMFEAAPLRKLLDYLAGKEVTIEEEDGEATVQAEANPALLAMTLLGLNCAYGNHDEIG